MSNVTVDDIRVEDGSGDPESILDATALAARVRLVDAAGNAVVPSTPATPQPVTVVDGGDVAQGARADAAVTDPAASGTVVGLLKGILTRVNLLLTGIGILPKTASTSDGYGAATTVTRPANTTAYTALDTVGGAVDLGVMGPSAGRVLLESVSLDIRIAAVPAGMANMRLALYSATPPSAIADNGAWTWAVADEAVRLAILDIGTPVDQGAGLYVARANIGQIVKLSGTNLFAYLITDGGFTPAAVSEVYTVTLHTVAL